MRIMSYEEAVDAGYDGPNPMFERQRERALLRHPDCRDPDHPGCKSCCPDDFEDE